MTVYLSWHSGTKDSETEKEVTSELPEFPEETVNDSQEDISEKDTPEKDMQIGIVGKEKVQDMSVTFEVLRATPARNIRNFWQAMMRMRKSFPP